VAGRAAQRQARALSNFAASLGWGLAVGATLLAGAFVAVALHLPQRIAAVVTSFGGGLLLAAIAFELAPEADAAAGVGLTAGGLVAGTLVYVGADAWLSRDPRERSLRRAGHAAMAGRPMRLRNPESARGEAIAAGLFVDGVPESIALGLTIAEGKLGLALLVGILVGNVVEAYGASQPIVAGGHTKSFAVLLMGVIGVALAGATVLGGTVDAGARFVGTAEAVAAGAVLAVVTISIVPHAFAEVSRLVATATVAGFVAGYLLS
jgi:ZIP family zinc transporter